MTAVAPPELAAAPSLRQRLFDARGAGYPAFDASPRQKADYVELLLQDSEADAVLRAKRATQALLFSDGRQHIDWTTRERLWRDLPLPTGRLRVTMNYLRPILRSRMQRMVSAELIWRTIPQSNDYEERDRATTCTNFLAARWEKTEMDAKMRLALWFAFHCGVAVFKTFWNPAIGPLTPATVLVPHPETGQPMEFPVNAEGAPLADAQGQPAPVTDPQVFRYRPGDTDTALRTIFNLRMNPEAAGFAVDEGFRWLLDSEVVPVSVVKERYGARAARVSTLTGSATGRTYERLVRSLSLTLGALTPEAVTPRGSALPDKDLCLLTEYWEAPSELLPQGRLLVLAGGQLLYPLEGEDEGLPHGIVPFVPVYDERRPFDPWGRGVAEDLIAPQKVINRQWEAELEEQARHGLGQWVLWGIPGLSDQITNLTGAHIEVPMTSALAHRPIGDIVQRVPPPGFNATRWRLIQEAKATLFDIGAFHEIQRGQVPPGIDSGIAVQYLQEAENAQLHDPVRNLKQSLKRWARQQLALARWGYGENEVRWLPVHRPDLGYLVEGVRGADLPDPDDVDIDLEGFRPTSQAALRADIKEFMEKGFLDPRRGLQLMDLGRGIEGAFESQTRHYARARRENLAIQRDDVVQIPPPEGTPTAALGYALVHRDQTPYLLPADDEHTVHVEIHADIFLDDAQPWATRHLMGLHLAEHRLMAAQQLQQMATAQQPQPGATGGAPSGEGT